jgi:RNA polymerase sigma-70 factor (ECF subfamily)
MLRRYATSTVDPVAPDVGSGAHGFDPTLAAVLGAMRKEHRDVLFLHAVADLSLEQIAVALDVPLGTVKAWLSRARDFAAAELGRHQDTTLVGKERSADGHA